MMNNTIPQDESNGRTANGKFAVGNKLAKGNPYAKKVGILRAELLSAVTIEDIRAVIAKLIEKAKGGDLAAIKEVFDRTLGKPVETDLIERLDELEAALAD